MGCWGWGGAGRGLVADWLVIKLPHEGTRPPAPRRRATSGADPLDSRSEPLSNGGRRLLGHVSWGMSLDSKQRLGQRLERRDAASLAYGLVWYYSGSVPCVSIQLTLSQVFRVDM